MTYPIWDPFERILWGFALITAVIGGILYIKKAREREDPKERIIIYSFSSILLCGAVSIVFFYLNDVFVSGTYNNMIFYGDFDISNPTYEILFKLGWSFYYLALTIVTFGFEKTQKRTYYILTIIGVINLMLFILTPLILIRNLGIDIYVFSYSGLVYWVVSYIYSRWTDMEFKVISSYFLLYAVFAGWGFILTMDEVKENNLFPLFLAPLYVWFAMMCVTAPLLIKTKNLRNSLVIWQFLMITNIITMMVMITLVFQNFQIYTLKYSITPSSFLVTSVFIEISNLRTLLSFYKGDKVKKPEDQKPGIFSMFLKPQKLTEEEVTVSKEKKICLVCKSTIGGMNFMCNDCGTFYCNKCYDALADLENACWACDTVLDSSKAVYLPKKSEELAEDVEIHKGGVKK